MVELDSRTSGTERTRLTAKAGGPCFPKLGLFLFLLSLRAPKCRDLATGSQTVLSLSYSWVLPGNVNNGSVYQINNNLDSSNNRSFQYSYDQLNRLQTAGTVSGASSPWTTTYGYDNWGNLLQKSTTGPGEPSMGPITADVHNHVNPSGYTYDAAGNLTFDGVNNMSYDAENRLTPTYGGWVYSYDGDGHRVEKNYSGTITYYWYDDNFKVISTTGNYVRDYVYFNGRRVAYYSPSSGNQHYYWSDHLGSERTMSNSSGSTIEWEGDYYPFGGNNVLNNGLDNFNQFTDYEYDYELGDSYAENREQSPVLGRFFSPDPLAGAIGNPQSLNRYTYVVNNPLNGIDPSGMACKAANRGRVARVGICGGGVPWWASAFGGGGDVGLDGGGPIDAGSGLLGGSESSTQCPNNICNGYATDSFGNPILDSNGNPTWVQFESTLGGVNGYYNPSQASGGYDMNGILYTAKGYFDTFLSGYVATMHSMVAGLLGIDPSKLGNCTSVDCVVGGNANFTVSADLANAYILDPSNDCMAGSGGSYRCDGLDGSLHFHPDDLGGFGVHLDSANPFANVPLGAAVHIGVDVIGGNTIFQTGVPH